MITVGVGSPFSIFRCKDDRLRDKKLKLLSSSGMQVPVIINTIQSKRPTN